MPGRQAAEWYRRTWERACRGDTAQASQKSTGELGVTEEHPASLKTIKSEKIKSRFKVGGRPASEGKLRAMTERRADAR